MLRATVTRVIDETLPEELDRIFREHYQLVYRTAYGVTGRAEDAEDVLQTIFMQLLWGITSDLMRSPKAYLSVRGELVAQHDPSAATRCVE